MDAEYYLSLNYRLSVYKDDEGEFIVEVPDFPGCAADGRTAEEAFENVRSAMRAWVEARLEAGLAVPEPRASAEFSGRLVVRMPRSLHQRLAFRADEEGISLNQYIVSLLSAGSTAAVAAGTPLPTAATIRYIAPTSEPGRVVCSLVGQSGNLVGTGVFAYRDASGNSGWQWGQDLIPWSGLYPEVTLANQANPTVGNKVRMIPESKTRVA